MQEYEKYSFSEVDNMQKVIKTEKYEKCVLCHKITSLKINTHIDLRENYIEGLGQLCPNCFYKISSDTDSFVNED